MTVVADKFIPMSLSDISLSLNNINDNISALRTLFEAHDVASLAEDISGIRDSLINLQSAVYELSQNSDASINSTVEDISDRVNALEEVNNNFFGA